jgi:hypothetical protein
MEPTFGCDRNGCSAEEGFILGNVATAVVSVFGTVLVAFIASIFEARDFQQA